MSTKGNPYDNAFAESFMRTLKQEKVYLWEYETFSNVAERIPYFIEDVYNKKRLHSSLAISLQMNMRDHLLKITLRNTLWLRL